MRGTLKELRTAGGFFAGLRPFLRQTPDALAGRRSLEESLARRHVAFAATLRRSVYQNPGSPYARLLHWAGFGHEAVERLVEQIGLEGALERLHDAGVYVALAEFKGLQPILRPGLEIPAQEQAFDNPVGSRGVEARTGGSGGVARRILIDLELLEHEAAYHACFLSARAEPGRPMAMWLPAPPGAVGIKNALIRARLGRPVQRWFSQNRPEDAPIKHRALAGVTARVAAGCGASLPVPEFVSPTDPAPVVAWLAGHVAEGSPGGLLCTPAAAVRTCAEAIARGIDIAGSLFVVVGEPYTDGKAAVVAAAGCTARSNYAMVEAGMIGLACDAPAAPDEVHLVLDKLATIQRDRVVGDHTVPAMFHTTLLFSSPKVMLNVESGDYGTIEERDCGCGVLPAGFRRHLRDIRSYEKLTAEGMHFVGVDLLSLLETELPRRFGGRPTDYQFVESEQDGMTHVNLVVSPAVGDLDPERVVATALHFLERRGVGQRLMSEVWARAGTLRVVRDQPHVTPAGKIQPLHKMRTPSCW